MEINDFHAPQGCFQSLRLTSSLRDCGHRHGTVSALGTSSTLLPACFTHLVPFSFFSNSVGVRKKLQKVRYPLCPPVLNGLPSRAAHTTAPNFAHYRSCGYFGSVWLRSPNSLNILRRNRKVKKPSSTLVFFTHGSRFLAPVKFAFGKNLKRRFKNVPVACSTQATWEHPLALSSGCGYFGSVWLRSPNSLNYPTPVSYGYNKSKFNTCFCFHTRLTLLSSLVYLGTVSALSASPQRTAVTSCTHHCPKLRSLSLPCKLKFARLG